MEKLLIQLLAHYHLSEEDYRKMSLPLIEISLLDPHKIDGMNKVVERIFKAIQNKEKIIIYGD